MMNGNLFIGFFGIYSFINEFTKIFIFYLRGLIIVIFIFDKISYSLFLKKGGYKFREFKKEKKLTVATLYLKIAIYIKLLIAR